MSPTVEYKYYRASSGVFGLFFLTFMEAVLGTDPFANIFKEKQSIFLAWPETFGLMSCHKMTSQVSFPSGLLVLPHCLKMTSSSGDCNGKRKRQPGKRCIVVFCNNTNDNRVCLHQFTKDEKVCQKWIEFVVRNRGRRAVVKFAATILKKKIPKIIMPKWVACARSCCYGKRLYHLFSQPRTASDSEQQQEADFRNKSCCSTSWTTATSQRTALTKLQAHRVSISSISFPM